MPCNADETVLQRRGATGGRVTRGCWKPSHLEVPRLTIWTMSGTIDVVEAKVKLGRNLQYVVAVERALAEEKLSEVYFGKA